MSVGTFIGICVGSFALLAVIIRRAHEYGKPAPQTVEQEQAASREVIGYIGFHHPASDEADQYCADDPIQSVMNIMSDNRTATGL